MIQKADTKKQYPLFKNNNTKSSDQNLFFNILEDFSQENFEEVTK